MRRTHRRHGKLNRAGDLLRPDVARELDADLAEERRAAEEADDEYLAAMSEEIEAYPIGHPGHVPHGCT